MPLRFLWPTDGSSLKLLDLSQLLKLLQRMAMHAMDVDLAVVVEACTRLLNNSELSSQQSVRLLYTLDYTSLGVFGTISCKPGAAELRELHGEIVFRKKQL